MRKYDPLHDYLLERTEEKITLSISDIEKIIGTKLPQSAHLYDAWWSNSKTHDHPHSHSWTTSGYRTVDVNKTIMNEIVSFEKIR